MPKVPELELPRKKGTQVQHLSKLLIYENRKNIYRPHLTHFSTLFQLYFLSFSKELDKS
jgi:hypothetical protein